MAGPASAQGFGGPGGGPPGFDGPPPQLTNSSAITAATDGSLPAPSDGTSATTTTVADGQARLDGGAPMGGPGGQVSDELIAYLEQNRGSATWLVAVSSANSAADHPRDRRRACPGDGRLNRQ
jgi:hypothetical protein